MCFYILKSKRANFNLKKKTVGDNFNYYFFALVKSCKNGYALM